MKFRVAISAAIASVMMVSAAAAASLSISGGTSFVLGSDELHDPNYKDPTIAPSVGNGDSVLAFGDGFTDFDGSNGLKLSDNSIIQVTFLGKEANATNVAMNYGTGSITNNDLAGSFFRTNDDPDWVELVFETFDRDGDSLGTIENNTAGQTYDGLSMAFFQENSKNVIAFFGDGRGDTDFDDMVVRISIVPLPAGGVLLLTALGGLAVARRKKKAA